MAQNKGGLGKGLGALIPNTQQTKAKVKKPQIPTIDAMSKNSTKVVDAVFESAEVSRETLVEVPGAQFLEIKVKDIKPNDQNPRMGFDEKDMAELVHSIQTIGVLQPIVVRRAKEGSEVPYQLVMGERRWRATKIAGQETIPAIIRETSDDDVLRDALLENLHRSQLNAIEEAAAYQQLLDDFGGTHDELADRLGRSRSQVSNMLRLLKLPPTVQQSVASGELTAGHARTLLGLPNSKEIEAMADRIIKEGISVRKTEELVATANSRKGRRAKKESSLVAEPVLFDEYTTKVSELLNTSVKISLNTKKGIVAISFYSMEDLNRIMGIVLEGSSS